MKITPNTITKFPNMVVVAITNACTHLCIHCQHKYYSQKECYKDYYMQWPVFEKIVNEMTSYPDSLLRICAWGEPCLHQQLIEFIDFAHTKRVKTILLTNGYLLNSSLSKRLMQAGLNMAEISVDAAIIETYQKVRYSKDADAFNKVVKNAETMIDIRNYANYDTKIAVSYVTWPTLESEKEYEKFYLYWQYKADIVVKRRLTSFCGAVDPELIKVPENRKPCYGLWARFNINPWGKVQLCYNQWEKSKWIIGNLNESDISIASIWNSEELYKIRKQQIADIYVGPCSECKDYNPFAWEHPFEEVFQKATTKKL